MINSLLKVLDSYSGPVKIIIRDVGHGNWNEIQLGSIRIIFDIGAQKEWGEKKVRKILDNAKIVPDEDIYIFLSHWDTDHYHAILKMTDIELKSIKGFFAPSHIPATNTAYRVQKRLASTGISINLLPFTRKVGTDRKIELNLNYHGKSLKLFRSTRTNNRNLDSIVFYFQYNGKCLLFSGDQNYEKLYEYVVNKITPIHPMILLLPHHGGSAGNFKGANWRSTPLDEIIVSYHDSNTYGHPLCTNIHTSASLLPSSKSIISTNGTGDKVFYF